MDPKNIDAFESNDWIDDYLYEDFGLKVIVPKKHATYHAIFFCWMFQIITIHNGFFVKRSQCFAVNNKLKRSVLFSKKLFFFLLTYIFIGIIINNS